MFRAGRSPAPPSADQHDRIAASLLKSPPVGQPTSPSGRGITDFLGRSALVGALLVIIVIFSILKPETFPTIANLQVAITSQAVLLILALAVTIPLRAGDFDLSIAATMAASAALTAQMSLNGYPVAVAMAAGLALGVVVGVINAIIIVLVKVNAFIVTLGTMTVLGGVAYAVTSGNTLSGLPNSLLNFGRANVVGGLPAGVFYGFGLAIVLWYVYEWTPFGRQLLFVGGNPDASRLAGVPVTRVRMLAFILSATLSAFAGLLLVSTLGAFDPTTGPEYLLPPYAAAFLSTTVIQIGRFNVIGTIIGLYLLEVGVLGLQLFGALPWVSDVFNGGALVIAVVFARLIRGRQTT